MLPMSSPFASKLGTNYCPTDTDIIEIKSLLVEPLSRLAHIDSRIADLQETIDKLTEERTALGTYVDAHKALLSPVRRIPLDILQEIFVACLPTHQNCAMTASEPPILLGRVCSAWRTLSFLNPRLWTRLHIAEPQIPADTSLHAIREQKYTQRVEVTTSWLKRSGKYPLSISVFGSANHFAVSPEFSGQILRALIPFASQWRNITIGGVTTTVLEALASVTAEDVPVLQAVNLYSIYESQQQTNTQWDAFGLLNAPSLSCFSFLGACRDLLTFPLQWARITRLYIASQGWNPHGPPLTSHRAVEILSLCLHLRIFHLLVDDRVPSPDDLPRQTILELPCLLELGISSLGKPVNRTGGLFSYVALPELRFLGMQPTLYPPTDDDEVQITYFPLLATSPRLETLEIDTGLFNTESFAELLRTLPPAIRQLEFTGHGDLAGLNDEVLAALTPSSGRSFSCPNLQELQITNCDLSAQAILDFIKARMAAEPTTLRQVKIHLVRKMEQDIRPDIQPFLDAGLELDITHPSPPSWSASPWLGLSDLVG
ncbi:hypothetical protein MSAN_00087000 [Mycena sanguinolenta]|uniref:F-box domain-containing protein n=1 Tax=Mycena sanguinolenta TaxID=230812 RepID=A0A8H6ZJK4_9AGAR|nr:hypothetical protein MSAN_00087000 [Mycena sanguinolenta]